jgi:6-phosphogluconolactonase (cycloisomerase 2 family)
MSLRVCAGLAAGIVCLVLAAPAAGDSYFFSPEMAIAPDDGQLYVAGNTLTTFGREKGSGALTTLDELPLEARNLAIAPDGLHVYAAGRYGLHVLSRDARTGLLTHQATLTGVLRDVGDLVISPDGRFAYAIFDHSDELAVLARDPASGQLTRVASVYGGPSPGELEWLHRPIGLSLSPDGDWLYVGMQFNMNKIGAFRRDAATGLLDPAWTIDSSVSPWDIALSPDGRRLYAGTSDVAAFDRDIATGELTPLNGLSNSCGVFLRCNQGWSLAPSPDGTLLMTSRHLEQNLVQAKVVPDGLERQADYVQGQDGALGLDNPLELVWSHDGRFLYTGAARNMWIENGELYVTDASSLYGFGVYRRDPGSERLTPLGVATRPPKPFPGPPVPPYTVTIENGARFTNSAQVTVKVTGVGTSLRLSNDELFAGSAMRLRADGRYPWTLVDTGLGRDVRRVYVRFTWGGPSFDKPPPDLTDDIVLDQRPPVLVSARAARRAEAATAAARRARPRLLLRARDNRSGVRRVQVTSRRARPGKARRFRRTLVLARLPRHAWVRVLDGAGNRSRWRRIRER